MKALRVDAGGPWKAEPALVRRRLGGYNEPGYLEGDAMTRQKPPAGWLRGVQRSSLPYAARGGDPSPSGNGRTQNMDMRRLSQAGFSVVLVLAVAATVHAVKKPVPADRSMRDATVEDVEAGSEVSADESTGVAGHAPGCEPIGGTDQSFSFASVYRGNQVRIDGGATLLSFCMELSFTGTTDLYFSIHRLGPEGTCDRSTPDVALRDEQGLGVPVLYCATQPRPIVLVPGEYSFGVTWGNRSVVTYFRDRLFDQTFVVGRVLGAIALNGVSPPLEDSLPCLPDDRWAYSMEICLAPEKGACCSALDGGCVSVFEEECTAEGAFFHGQRTSCSETPCGFGRCCTACGQCKVGYTPEACLDEDGAFWPGELDCPAADEDLCRPITGACCNFSGGCVEKCADQCGGTYRGDGTSCEPNICKGACCVTGGCIDTTQAACAAFDGVFKDDGTTCTTLSPEKECGGACCTGFSQPPNLCGVVPQRAFCTFETEWPVTVYRGDGQPCPDFFAGEDCTAPANDPYGACCLPDGLCLNTTESFCTMPWVGGTYKGAGTECDIFTCQGACCFTDGTCEALTHSICIELPLFKGWMSEVVCDPGLCAEPVGACCPPEGTCQDGLTQDECGNLDGLYQGNGMGCGAVTCVAFGVCCQADGTCLDAVTVDECMAITGDALAFQVGTVCESDTSEDSRGAS